MYSIATVAFVSACYDKPSMLHTATPNSTKIPFTLEGYAKLEAELEEKRAAEKGALERLVIAREMGDLSENGMYKYAKMELGDSRRRIREILHLLKMITPTPKPINPTKVVFGCTVVLEAETSKKPQTYLIVSTHEADPLAGKISPESPLGSALMDRKIGDTVSFTTPQGVKNLTIAALS